MNNLKTARLFFDECDGGKGWEACKVYCHANASFETPEALDEALAATCTQIAGNSAEAVAAMKDLYRLAETEQGIRPALADETASNYEISDTDERLSAF